MNIQCKVKQCEFNTNNQCTKDEIKIDFACDDYEYAYCTNYKEKIESIRNNHHIEKLDENETGYNYIVFSQNYFGVFDYLEEILDDIDILEQDNCTVKILIDNLLHNGNSANRYYELNYDCMLQHCDYDSVQVANISKQNNIRKISVEYYKNQSKLIENSILTSIQKKMILKGIAI